MVCIILLKILSQESKITKNYAKKNLKFLCHFFPLSFLGCQQYSGSSKMIYGRGELIRSSQTPTCPALNCGSFERWTEVGLGVTAEQSQSQSTHLRTHSGFKTFLKSRFFKIRNIFSKSFKPRPFKFLRKHLDTIQGQPLGIDIMYLVLADRNTELSLAGMLGVL